MGLGNLNDALGIGADQIGMQVALCLRVPDHGLPQGGEIARIQGIAGGLSGGSQWIELFGGGPQVLQVANHPLVYLGRAMGPAQIDQGQPALQIPPGRVIHSNL